MQLDAFQTLADPTRRRIVETLHSRRTNRPPIQAEEQTHMSNQSKTRNSSKTIIER
jgi:hypothetical protein